MASELNQLIKAAEQQGWDVEMRRGGHIKFTSPGGDPVFVSASASDHRWFMNTVSTLRRHGFEYDRGRGNERRLSVVGGSNSQRRRRRRRTTKR